MKRGGYVELSIKQVRLWREGEDIKNATDYNAGKEVDLYVDGLNPDILYKLRVFGWSRGGEGAMSFPTMKFMLGTCIIVDSKQLAKCAIFTRTQIIRAFTAVRSH